MSVTVTLNDVKNSKFTFDFTLTVEKNIESNYPNSSVAGQHTRDIYAGDEVKIRLFDESAGFFKDNSGVLGTFSEQGQIFANYSENSDSYFRYDLSLTATNSSNFIVLEETVVNDGYLSIKTKPVASETTIILKAVLTFEKTTPNGTYLLSFESFYSFKLLPDSQIEVYYPTLNGIKYESEKIVYSADENINLSINNSFRSKDLPRVKITDKNGNVVAKGTDLIVKIKLRIIAGERERLEFNGVKVNADNNDYDFFDTNFTFNFNGEGGISYSEVALDVYISGILRQTYKLDIYRDITSVYGIKINNINSLEEDNREVFYLGEDKREIFAGVQAIKFMVDANFKRNITLKVYKNQTSGTAKNLEMSIALSAIDANFIKLIKISQGTDINDLLDLTTDNIRFRIVENGSEGPLKTLTQIKDDNIFAITTTGDLNIQLLRRLEVTYLGESVQDKEFLEKIELFEYGGNEKVSNFKVKDGEEDRGDKLGGDNLYRNGNVEIYFGKKSGSNSLGLYLYKHRVNLQVGVSEYEINVGEEITKALDTFGIQKITGEKFVTYSGDNPTSYAEVIQQQRVSINLYFKTGDNGETDYRDAVTGEKYAPEVALAPITISERNIISTSIRYDFRLLANGSNNNGVKAIAIFEYKYKDPDNNPNNDIIFLNEIEITIKPVWEVYTNNRYITGANSAENPEIITSDLFPENENVMSYILIDIRTTGENRGIVIRKQQGSGVDTKNYAIDFEYIEFEGEGDAYASMGNPIRIEGQIVAKQININKPSFQERDLVVILKDAYGFSVKFYFKILPTTLIQYDSGLHNSQQRVYEGNSFMLQHSTTGDFSGIDHIVFLTEQAFSPSSQYKVKFSLINNSTKDDIAHLTDDFVKLDEVVYFKYLNSEMFVRSLNNVLVYMKIEIKKEIGNSVAEIYTINSQTFYLYQRYVTSVGSTKISDGRETNLVNHIDIEDKKFSASLGTPYLINDQTLVIKDSTFYGTISVLGFNSADDKKIRSITVPELTQTEKTNKKLRYISLETYFGNEVANILSYSFRLIEITDEGLDIKISYTNEANLQVRKANGDSLDEGTKYLIRMGDSTEVRDVIVDASTAVTVTVSGRKLGIIGYEKYSEETSFMMELQKNETDNKQENLVLKFPTGEANLVTNYKITLTNYGTSNNNNIKTIKIDRVSATTYNLETYTGALNPKIEKIEGIALASNSIIKLKFNHNEKSYNFIDNGEDWVITEYQYNVNGSDDFKDNVKFVSVIDKKLTIVTAINEKATSTAEKPVYETVKVYFSGVDKVNIEVVLDKNEKQEFSILQTALENPNWKGYKLETFDASGFALRYPNPIETKDMSLVKGITYYNDTVQFKLGAVQGSGVINFRLSKQNDSGTVKKDFAIEVSSYAKTFTLGLSQAFKDIDGKVTAVGDKYSLQLLSIPDTVIFSTFKVIWPDGNEFNLDFTQTPLIFENLDFGTYTVTSLNNALIVDGEITINLDSKELYERYYNTKEVPINQYYLIGFNQAIHYVDPVEFKVSPYYYGLDTSEVYGGSTQQIRVISDYSQYQTEITGNVAYIVQFETWTSGIPLVDPYGNYIKKENGDVLYLYEELNKNDAIVKVSLDTEGASGAGHLNEQRNLIVDIAKESNIENIYFVVDVLVARNGKLETDPANTEWLKIGEIRLAFNSHKQYFLEPGTPENRNGYVISTVKTDQDNNTETFVKYVEIDADKPTTFSVSKLFQDDTLELANVSTVKADGKKGLEKVYFAEKEISNYRVSYSIDGIQINSVIESTKTGLPIIIGNNISKGDTTINFELTIGGKTHTGSYDTNDIDNVLFGEISLANIISDDGESIGKSFATIIGETADYELTSKTSKAKIFWTKLDLTSIAKNFNIKFFGDGKASEDAKEVISGIIHASPMFQISKIGTTEDKIKEVKVIVAQKPLGTTNATVEYYAITQIQLDENQIVSKAQTVVYKVQNSLEMQSIKTIKLYGMFEDNGNHTNIVLVEKLSNITGLTGPALFNTGNKNFYEYNVGTLDIDKNNLDEENAEIENKVMVYKESSESSISVDNISNTFVIDFIKTTYEYTSSGVNYLQHAIILVNRLEVEEKVIDDVTTYDVTTNFTAKAGKEYNLITSDTRSIYGNTETYYTYEFVKSDRETMTFTGKETKFIISSENTGGFLIWHEFLNTTIASLPLGNIYYNYYDASEDETTTIKTNNLTISGMSDKDIISDMWDGTIFFADASNGNYAKVTYTTADKKDKEMYFIIDDFRVDDGNYIKLAELFKDCDSGNINKLMFSNITIHTSIKDDFLIPELSEIYKASYDEKAYSIFRINQDQKAENLTIFDLIKSAPGNDKISSILKDDIQLTPYNPLSVWMLTEGGYHSFYQEETGKFKVVNIDSGRGYDLFEIFETNLLSVSDGKITIAKLNTQIVVETTAVATATINIKLVQAGQELLVRSLDVVYSIERGEYIATINLQIGDNLTFLLALDSVSLTLYQSDHLGNPITEGAIIDGEKEISLVALDEEQNQKIIVVNIAGL